MLLLLYIDTNKQVNSEGETMRPNNGTLKCCRLLSKLKKQWWRCGFAHRAAGVPFVFASCGQTDQKARDLNT